MVGERPRVGLERVVGRQVIWGEGMVVEEDGGW